MEISGQPLCILMTITCGLQYLLYGYDQGFMSGVLLADDYLKKMGNPSTFMQGLITSIYELGCFTGCISSIFFSENLGRKKPILIGTVIVIIGAILQTCAFNRAQFVIGRIIAGFGTGLNTSIVPVWQAETLPAKKRELMGSLQYLLVCTGASISYWIDFALEYANEVLEWRLAVACQIVFAILLLGMIPFMPESPRWLMMNNLTEQSVGNILKMHGTTDVEDEEVQTEIKLINHALKLEEMSGAAGWMDLFTNKKETQNLRRLLLGWWLMAMVMLSGVCSIGYYISYLFETSVGLSHNLSLLLSGFNGLWYLASAILPFFVLKHIGKRWSLMIGAFGMGCCFLTMALTVRNGGHTASIICVIAYFLYYTFFALGWLAVPWLFCAEIQPLHLRSKANALTTSGNWIWNFATVMTPSTMGNLGWKAYLIFMAFNFAFVAVVYVFYPETTGRRLEEIDLVFYRTGVVVAGTKWARKGHFEADELARVVAGEAEGLDGKGSGSVEVEDVEEEK